MKIPKSTPDKISRRDSITNLDGPKTPWLQTVTSRSRSRFSCTAYANDKSSPEEPMNTRGFILKSLEFELYQDNQFKLDSHKIHQPSDYRTPPRRLRTNLPGRAPVSSPSRWITSPETSVAT